MRRRLFNAAVIASLLLCVAVMTLWVRSLGHFELVTMQHVRWPRTDEVYEVFVSFSWYSSTLRLEVIRRTILPTHSRVHPGDWATAYLASNPEGLRWDFVGDNVTGFMNGYPPGFSAGHFSYGTGPTNPGDRWVLSVRPWLPALLTAALPAMWLYRFGKSRRAGCAALCPTCGYDLRGTPASGSESKTCPECDFRGAPSSSSGETIPA